MSKKITESKRKRKEKEKFTAEQKNNQGKMIVGIAALLIGLCIGYFIGAKHMGSKVAKLEKQISDEKNVFDGLTQTIQHQFALDDDIEKEVSSSLDLNDK